MTKIWFDISITPHLALSPRGLRLVSILLLFPALVLGAFLMIFKAWPATCFVGGESFLAVFALHWCAHHLSRQGERVLLTDQDLIVERWNKLSRRSERMEPAWVRLERRMHEEFGCEALFLRVSNRRLRVAAALGAEGRAQFADQLEAALDARKRGFATGARA
jgi:uncharacterized membrane protein